MHCRQEDLEKDMTFQQTQQKELQDEVRNANFRAENANAKAEVLAQELSITQDRLGELEKKVEATQMVAFGSDAATINFNVNILVLGSEQVDLTDVVGPTLEYRGRSWTAPGKPCKWNLTKRVWVPKSQQYEKKDIGNFIVFIPKQAVRFTDGHHRVKIVSWDNRVVGRNIFPRHLQVLEDEEFNLLEFGSKERIGWELEDHDGEPAAKKMRPYY